jgi:predicted dehydrogenase
MSERKIRVAVVGTGFGKTVQIPGFRACPNAEIYAICASSLEKAHAVQQEFNIPHAFANYREMLKLKELDLVSIVTPPHLHKSMSVAALKAGKHVLCEKPTAMNLREADTMWKHAKESDLVALIDHEMRLNPLRRRIKELIEGKLIGKLRHAQVSLAGNFRADSPRAWDWWSDKRRGGGVLGAIGSHQIDLLRWWFGEIESVCGHLKTFVAERPLPGSQKPRRVTTDDFCWFALHFEKGGFAQVQLSAVARHAGQTRLEICGDEGSILLVDEKLYAGRMGEPMKEITDLNPLPNVSGMPEGVFPRTFALFAEYLTDCLAQRKPPELAATFYDGMQCQAILDAAKQSSRKASRWVRAVQ